MGSLLSGSLVNPAAVIVIAIAIPREVAWSYFSFGAIFAIGLATIFVRGDWQKARGLSKLVLFGPIFYAAPLAGFGTEHFTLTKDIASIIPSWIPWHLFWTYLVGSCFIAAALSLVIRVHARLAASLVALTFLLFVVLMDVPGWLQDPRNRIALALALRELSFCAGPLALAASLARRRTRAAEVSATVARYFIAIAVLVYSFEQFRHGDHVPGVPLERLTPAYVLGHAIWTYVAAAVYAVAGALLLIGKRTRAAATRLGLTVLFVEVVVYVPIAVVDRATLVGFNFMADTLMFCGAVLLLAGALFKEGPAGSGIRANLQMNSDQKRGNL